MINKKTNAKLSKLVAEYGKVERKIWAELKKLPRFGKECNCGFVSRDTIDLIENYDDHFSMAEMSKYCFDCGGKIVND